MDFLFQRQIGRVQSGDRIAGRAHAAAIDCSAASDALLHVFVVARFEEAALYGHEFESVGARYRVRRGEDGRQRSVDGAYADAQSGVVARFEMGGVFEPVEVSLS